MTQEEWLQQRKAFAGCLERLGELACLNDGWYDGDCYPPTAQCLRSTAHFLGHVLFNECTFPTLFPTLDAGIQMEWSINGWEITLEVDRNGFDWFNALNVQTGEDRDGDTCFDIWPLIVKSNA